MVYTVRPPGCSPADAPNSKPNDAAWGSCRRLPERPTPPPAACRTLPAKPEKWLRAQPVQATSLAEPQALIDRFIDTYNHRRPHRSLHRRRTPETAYTARSKATPYRDRSRETHDRVRHDIIDVGGTISLRVNGRLRAISGPAACFSSPGPESGTRVRCGNSQLCGLSIASVRPTL